MCDNPEPIGDGICEGSNEELLDCGGAFTDDCSTVFHNFYHQTMFCTEASSGNNVCDFHSCVESCYHSGTHLYFSYHIHTLYIIVAKPIKKDLDKAFDYVRIVND